MTITMIHVTNLIKLLGKGLISGAGNTKDQFCIQQAVHRAITDDLDNQTKSDHPPTGCVHGKLTSFGIQINDTDGWVNDKARADGLRRFAIAELGSNKITSREFYSRLIQKIKMLSPEYDQPFERNSSMIEEFMKLRPWDTSMNDWLTKLANLAADTLQELGTEGSKFLWILNEPDKKKRAKAAWRLGDKIYAAQLANMGSDCAFGLPTKRHH